MSRDGRVTIQVGRRAVDVRMSHRTPFLRGQSSGPVGTTAVTLRAGLPVSVDDVAALLYASADEGDVTSTDVALSLVADLLINGGLLAVEDARCNLVDDQRAGRVNARHLAVCQRWATDAVKAAGGAR